MMRMWRLLCLVPATVLAQVPDTTTRPVLLPTVETRADRPERESFESAPNVGRMDLQARMLTSSPRFFGEADILRAVRTLPGVNARNDYSVGMNVRGGEADQNLVLLDGHPIYNPFHMAGIFGAFVEPMVSDVTFLTGGFPARYGGRLSSVLDISSRVEPRPGLHGSVNLSMVATTLSLGSATHGGRHTWNVAARRTYADKVVDLFYDSGLPYHFRDMQAHTTHALPLGWTMSTTWYDNVDALTQPSGIESALALRWGNRLFGTTLSRTFRNVPGDHGIDSVRIEHRMSGSSFALGMNLLANSLTLRNAVRDRRVSGQFAAFGEARIGRGGYELSRQDYRFNANYPLLLYPADTLESRNVDFAVFYDDYWRPAPRWIVQSGLRLEVVSPLRVLYVQPRVALKYFMDPNLAVTAAYGEFVQAAHSLAREDVPIRALDFWVGSDSRAPVSRARHFIAGLERWLSGNRAFRIEAYLKQYPGLVEQNPFSDPTLVGDEFNRLRGVSYGADFMLRQFDRGGWGGWLSYNLVFNRRVTAAGVPFFPGQDRRHELNVVLSREGARYTLATRFNLSSGTPYTPLTGEYSVLEYDPVAQDYVEWETPQFLTGARNSDRLPLASRLDVSLTRRGNGRVSVSPFLSVMNVYNARNPFAYAYDYGASPPARYGLPQLPVLPTIGVSVVW